MKKIVAYLFSLLLLASACKKDSYITSRDALVALSTDTLHFDTVFTTVGSVTQSFKILNQNKQKIKLSSVALMGGTGSSFKINVDGTPGPAVKDLTIEANDSMYVFVSVTINPNLAANPFIISDSIAISYNGNVRYLQLQAYGQNANFLRNQKIEGNVFWTNGLPYVILGSLQVDTNAVLTIQKGCKIYLHADAPFLVDGTLIVSGEKYDSTRVYFKGDRRDDPYNGYPGSWPGIYFRGQSKNSVLQFAVIQNAYQGVVSQLPSVNANPKLVLNECIIDNIYDAGILGIQSAINARNCLISNCGAARDGNGNITLAGGGNYNFIHCTSVGISNNYVPHTHAVLAAYNYFNQANVTYTYPLNAHFTNCLFWGDSLLDGNEIIAGKQGTDLFAASFENCLWRQKLIPSITGPNLANLNIQGDGMDTVLFTGINRSKMIYNFRLKDQSPAIDIGQATGIVYDLDGNPRSVGLPDAGCYEKQ